MNEIAGMSTNFPASKAVREARYSPLHRGLRVVYRDGRIYEFEDVTPEEWQGLLQAESTGRYIAHFLRTCKTCRELPDVQA